MRCDIEIAKDKSSAKVQLAGSMDSHAIEQVSNVFRQLLDQSVFDIAVNMKEVDYLSSACIGVLIQAQSEAQTNGGEIRLSNIQSGVKRTLELMGLFHMMSDTAV